MSLSSPLRNGASERFSALRQSVIRCLKTEPFDGVSLVEIIVIAMTTLCIATVILETEAALKERYVSYFHAANFVFFAFFSVEYAARLWLAGDDPRYAGWKGRLRYALTPMAVIDLLAIAPFFLGIVGSESILLRSVRFLRLLILLRIPRIRRAVVLFAEVIRKHHTELIVSVTVFLFIIFMAATVLYYCERHAQPEAFGSIPRALWWSAVTMTTVGYGDVYPITLWGRAFTFAFAMAGVGTASIPVSVMAMGFIEEINALKKKTRKERERGEEEGD